MTKELGARSGGVVVVVVVVVKLQIARRKASVASRLRVSILRGLSPIVVG
jgi:hypothetical protein